MAIGSRGLRGGEGGLKEMWRMESLGVLEGLKRHWEGDIRGFSRRRRHDCGRRAMVVVMIFEMDGLMMRLGKLGSFLLKNPGKLYAPRHHTLRLQHQSSEPQNLVRSILSKRMNYALERYKMIISMQVDYSIHCILGQITGERTLRCEKWENERLHISRLILLIARSLGIH